MRYRKIGSLILVLIFLFKVSTARTIKHQSIVVRPNGEKIVRSWTTHEDSDESDALNSGIYIPPHFEDTQDGADEQVLITAPNFNNFGLPTFTDNEFRVKFEEPQNKLRPTVKKGQFEEAWDMEPDFKASADNDAELISEKKPIQELTPQPSTDTKSNTGSWRSLVELAQQPNSPWKPIVDDNVYIENNLLAAPSTPTVYGHSFNTNTGFQSWPVVQKPQTTWHVTQTYASKPATVSQVSTYHGPQTIFTETWPKKIEGWTHTLNEDPIQISWEDVIRKQIPPKVEKSKPIAGTTKLAKSDVPVQPAKIPEQSMEDILRKIIDGNAKTAPPSLEDFFSKMYGSPKPTTVTVSVHAQKSPGKSLEELLKDLFEKEAKTKSLDNLINEIYGEEASTMTTPMPSMKKTTKQTTTTTTTTTPAPTTSTTTTTTPKPITTIDIKDLPIAEILNNGQPIDESYLKSLPEHFRPYDETLDDIRRSYHIQNIPMSYDGISGNPVKPVQRPQIPSDSLEPPPPPPPLEISHTLKSITTTPSPVKSSTAKTTTSTPLPIPPIPSRTFLPPFLPTPPSRISYSIIPDTTLKPKASDDFVSDIEKFLNKVGLHKDDALFQAPGRTVTKTIIDENGDVLTATFMISSVEDREAQQNKAKVEIKPLK